MNQEIVSSNKEQMKEMMEDATNTSEMGKIERLENSIQKLNNGGKTIALTNEMHGASLYSGLLRYSWLNI